MDRARLTQERRSDGNIHHPPKIIEHSVETKDVNKVTKTDGDEKILEVFPRDLQQKEKFIKHLTGPLYFSPKCSKHFYKLYHHTRDCTIPAYYKRCARLLTRLAGSQRCSEGQATSQNASDRKKDQEKCLGEKQGNEMNNYIYHANKAIFAMKWNCFF